ncbi:glycosyltransferase [soil metagenome]
MSSALTVALVASSFAPHIGGVETVVDRTARQLVALGHTVEVWTVDRGERVAVGPEGVVVRYLPTPLPARTGSAIWHFLRSGPQAWRRWSLAHRALRPDLLHVHCFGPNGLYALGLSLRFRTPLMVTSHGETRADDGGAFAESALLRGGLRCALRRAVLATAPSDYVLRDLRATYGLLGGEVVPNGVDMAITASPEEGHRQMGDRYFLSVGRLGRMKGFDLLLKALAIADLDVRTSLVIAGDGPEREGLATLARELGIADRVALVGWLDRQEVANAMAGARAVVVPSRVEAFGIVVLEAWRSGVPVIVTARGGASEFATDDVDCLIVDPVDAAALSAALQRLDADEALRHRLSAAGSSRYGMFSWPHVAQLYADAYGRVARPIR